MSSRHTYCFLINCTSNASRAERIFKKYEEKLLELFPGAEFIYIRIGDSLKEIARRKAKNFTHIIACGGDGTVNQTANGLIGTTAILGVLPLGSGNDFSKSIGLSSNFEKNIEVLVQGQTKKIDVIKSKWGYFLNTFGIGVDGLTNYYASRSLFRRGGLRYFWGGIQALIQSKPFFVTISINDTTSPLTYRAWMVAVANGKTEGGKYTISPTSVNHDGKMEVVVVKDIPKVRLLLEFLKLSFGISFNENVVDIYSTDEQINITTEMVLRIHADGEQVKGEKSQNFELIQSALKVITG